MKKSKVLLVLLVVFLLCPAFAHQGNISWLDRHTSANIQVVHHPVKLASLSAPATSQEVIVSDSSVLLQALMTLLGFFAFLLVILALVILKLVFKKKKKNDDTHP